MLNTVIRLETASAIAKDAGLVHSDEDVCLASTMLNSMSDEEVKEDPAAVFRCHCPEHFLRISPVWSDSVRKKSLWWLLTGDGDQRFPGTETC